MISGDTVDYESTSIGKKVRPKLVGINSIYTRDNLC
jgi:hypothetical protein